MVFHAPERRHKPSGSRKMKTKDADVAQLVEHHLAKVRVAGSNPVVRSESVSRKATALVRQALAWWVGREARQRTANPCTPVQIRYPPRLQDNSIYGRLAQW